MTTIYIDERTIITRKGDELPQEALGRTIVRLYGANAFYKSRYDAHWQAEKFRGYADIYRTMKNTGNGWSASLVKEHVWIEVY